MTIVVAPSGPLVAGDTWTLTLEGTDFRYTVEPGDTSESLASGIAELVDSSVGYVACFEGSVISITKLWGGPFSVDLVVDPW